jgi:putative tryptophan/tyrosine transport system substrate-binding protein
VRRRDLLALLGGAAAVLPLAARAQQPAKPVIGVLGAASEAEWELFAAAFRQGLRETGFVDGQNVAIEYRWAENRYDRLPMLAADLVGRQVSVIAVNGGLVAAQAAKAATAIIPVVFVIGGDPVQFGLVASLNRPGGNVTGITFLTGSTSAKRLELLREVVPTATVIGLLLNPSGPPRESDKIDVLAAARALGQRIYVGTATSERDFEPAFSELARERAGALIISPDALFTGGRDQLAALATRYAMPTIYHLREFVSAGGLMSYGTSIADDHRKAGIYTAMVLKGSKPAELPIQQPTKFELVINLKTAKALGLTVPQTLLAAADEIIE